MALPEFKTIERFDVLWSILGLFIPVPMSQGKYTPDYVVNGWGLSYTIAISKWRIPLGCIIILIAIIF